MSQINQPAMSRTETRSKY